MEIIQRSEWPIFKWLLKALIELMTFRLNDKMTLRIFQFSGRTNPKIGFVWHLFRQVLGETPSWEFGFAFYFDFTLSALAQTSCCRLETMKVTSHRSSECKTPRLRNAHRQHVTYPKLKRTSQEKRKKQECFHSIYLYGRKFLRAY